MSDNPKTTIEIYLAVNQDGDYMVSTESQDDAVGELQGNYTCKAVRIVALNVNLNLPTPETVEVNVEVPAQSQVDPAEVTVS